MSSENLPQKMVTFHDSIIGVSCGLRKWNRNAYFTIRHAWAREEIPHMYYRRGFCRTSVWLMGIHCAPFLFRYSRLGLNDGCFNGLASSAWCVRPTFFCSCLFCRYARCRSDRARKSVGVGLICNRRHCKPRSSLYVCFAVGNGQGFCCLGFL